MTPDLHVDAAQTSMLMSMFGGVCFPVGASSPGWLHTVADAVPTYWITQISRAPLMQDRPGIGGWVSLGVWAVVGARIAAQRYLADDLRVV